MTTPVVGFTAPTIKVAGMDLAPAWLLGLTSVRVQTELGLVGRTTLVFNDMGYELAGTTVFPLGAAVEVLVGDRSVFNGIVTGSALEHDASSVPRLVVTADDAGFRLGLTQRMRPYVQMTYADIIGQIASAHGLTATVDGGRSTIDHIVQRTSDLAFVEMLVRRLNRVWWIEGTALNVAKPAPSSAPTATFDTDTLREFSVRASGLRPLGVNVRGWDRKQKTDIVGQAAGSAAPATATSTFVTDYVGASPGSKLNTTSSSVLTTVANPLNQDEATDIASAQVASWGSSSVVAQGTVFPGTAELKLNGRVEVGNVGPMSGKYTVTSIEHVYSSQGLVTHFVCGSLQPSGLVDTLGTASGVDDGLTVRSLTTGLVTNNKDPDNLGRVKVKLAGTDDTVESDWARVMTLGGGAGRGVVFHPEINDEVVVAFERGDTRRPVVLGGLVNSKDALAAAGQVLDAGTGKVSYRRVTSRLGHVLELADGETPATRHIMLQLKDSAKKLRLGDDEMTIEMPAGKPFTIKVGSAKIGIDAQGNILIEGLKITLKATTDIELSAATKLAAKGLQLDLSGTTEAKLTGAMVSVEGQGQAALKGGIVMIN